MSHILYFIPLENQMEEKKQSDTENIQNETDVNNISDAQKINNLDPVSLVIPLCIEYILERELCEEKSLALYLQLDEKIVKQALTKLKKHGILIQDEINRDYFQYNYAQKLGVQVQEVRTGEQNKKTVLLTTNTGTNQNEHGEKSQVQISQQVQIYYFNIDLMYVLKARIWTLEEQLKQKLDNRTNRGHFYVCPDSLKRKCSSKDDVDEISWQTGRKNCQLCQRELVRNTQSTLTNAVANGCRQILTDLKTDLDALSKYRIPPQFFGPAAIQAQKSFQDDQFLFDQFDFESFNYIVEFYKEDVQSDLLHFQKEQPVKSNWLIPGDERVEKLRFLRNQNPQIFNHYLQQTLHGNSVEGKMWAIEPCFKNIYQKQAECILKKRTFEQMNN